MIETFKDKTLNAKNINPKFLSFKQQLLNDYVNSDKYKNEDFEKFKKSVIEINIWQWLVLTNLNVPSKYYIIFFYNPHPKDLSKSPAFSGVFYRHLGWRGVILLI